MLAAITTWLAAHPVVRGALWMLLVALIGALYNFVTYKRTAEEWERYQRAKPRRAAFIRLMRIVFPHLRKIPALKPFFPDDPTPPKSDGTYRGILPPDPPRGGSSPINRLAWLKLGIGAIAAATMLVGCPPSARTPSAQDVASMAISTVALGVRIADEHCVSRAAAIFNAGDKQGSLDLAMKCKQHYNAARSALMAAAYAVDGWSDAKNHGKAVCAVSEAATSLSFTVRLLKESKAWTPPREITMAISAAAVLADMVEAKQCTVAPAASGGAP